MNNQTGKTIASIAIFGSIGIIMTYFLITKLEKILKHNESKDIIRDSDKEIDEKTTTYTQGDYQSFADILFSAMNGVGTNFEIIKTNIKKLKTRADWYSLVKAFNVRETTSWVSTFKGNLLDWLGDELSTDEYKQISDLLKLINVII